MAARSIELKPLDESIEVMPCPECGSRREVCDACRASIDKAVERARWMGCTLPLAFGDVYDLVNRDHDR